MKTQKFTFTKEELKRLLTEEISKVIYQWNDYAMHESDCDDKANDIVHEIFRTRFEKKIEPIQFLDYTIKMTCDGIVISKDGVNVMPGAMNFGKVWNEDVLDKAKLHATILFMIARPEKFDAPIYYRLFGDDGSYWEHGILKNVLKEENIEMPPELEEPIDGLNGLIGFKGKKISIISH